MEARAGRRFSSLQALLVAGSIFSFFMAGLYVRLNIPAREVGMFILITIIKLSLAVKLRS